MARNYKNFTRLIPFLGLLMLSSGLSACQTVIDEPIPPEPGSPTPDAILYDLHMIWNRSDFISLNSLTVDHPFSIRFADGGTNDTLDIKVRLEVQKENSKTFVEEYKDELKKNNKDTWVGTDPKIIFPRRTCTQTKNETGLITDMVGICVRDLTITLPTVSSSLPLSFALDFANELRMEKIKLNRLDLRVKDFSITRLTQITGNVVIRGGGNFATLFLDQINAEANPYALDVELSSVKNLYAMGIVGGIRLDIKSPVNSDVQVDWVPIREFPYIHP
ncbi:MAG: hypothetical protein AABZ55_08970 [Bdellovibrionota bacterium]